MSVTRKVLLTVVLAANASPLTPSSSVIGKSKNIQSAVTSTSQARSRYVSANGIRVHYLEWGSGDSTVVLLHGLYDTSDTWAAFAPLLATHYRIIAPDRRGAGLSDKPATGYDYQTLARDVELLIVALKLGRVYLVGHSAGAGVTMTLAANGRNRINRFVLIDGGFWPKREGLSAGLSVQPCEDNAAACQRRGEMERAGKEYDPEKLYNRAAVPVLLVLGVPPDEEAKEFAAELREASQHVESVANQKLRKGQLAVIEGTSHWIQRDRPKELALVIQQFLKSGGATKRLKPAHNQRSSKGSGLLVGPTAGSRTNGLRSSFYSEVLPKSTLIQ